MFQLIRGNICKFWEEKRNLHYKISTAGFKLPMSVAGNGPFHLHWSIIDQHFDEVNDLIPDHVMSQYNR